MENKQNKTKLVVIIVVLIITNMITFAVATTSNVLLGNKMIITVDSNETAAGIKKLLVLKEQIASEYYQDVNNTTLIDGAIKGMFESLGDPYSTYYTSEEFSKYMEMATGSYEGIGVVVAEDEQGYTYVIAPQKGTPADAAGIKTGDKIIKVDGEDVSTIGADAVVAKVKGPADSMVNITIARGEEIIEMELVRKTIEAVTVRSRVIGDKGYIQISEFTDKTADDFETQINELMAQNITGLVIDLRSNPGGGVKEAVEIADRILGQTVVVYTVDKKGNKTDYTSDGEEQLSLPMVALVDGGTASSAEILAGALQDTGAAQLVGTKTFGKGIVQEVISLTDGGGFKVTNSEYFTPNGNNIHEKGLEPNIVIEATDFMMNNIFTDEEDVQLQKALEVLGVTN
ncbi:MAG: carboxyl-terminal processing protease [Acetobacterium sp.]|jgi:C-terminal peptidase (prc)|uniref:S41 family peptidase n=1 Tax=Acetobacterium TaxID=33951 RepID=UPI0029E5C571|nr:S41 family peptidase [Acetobacterium sp. K1/6]MDK2942391.1 carboxyl-terminal processing protease [Acetobacterium sp.]MDZ5724848.1 S41 family peptidase [Acetobacterium sp. K1/6]